MARNSATPLTFELPDGDVVEVITWDYVLEKSKEMLTPTIDHISVINSQLERIDNKLNDWVENDE